MAQVHNLQIEERYSEASMENEIGTQESNRNSVAREKHNLLCRELSCKLRSILRLMKITGNYSGDISLNELSQENSSNFFSRLYCGVVLLGQWILVVQAVISIFVKGLAGIEKFYFLLMFFTW